jgi:repressor of nif and glnA expression
LASKAAEPRQSLAAAISEVLDQHGALSAAELSERINAAGREVNNRAVSFALQGLKKRGLAKNTDGKWSAGKARGRRVRSTSDVSPIQSEAAE